MVRDGELVADPLAHIDVLSSSEQGLLGLALDPAFDTQPWIYVYYSDPVSHLNRLARISADDAGAEPEPLLDALTTEHGYHNGGDLVFGGDGKLYVAVGEVHEGERAQDPDDLGGKILRLNPDGSTPSRQPARRRQPRVFHGAPELVRAVRRSLDGSAVGDGERAGQRRRGQPHRARRQLRLAGPARSGG